MSLKKELRKQILKNRSMMDDKRVIEAKNSIIRTLSNMEVFQKAKVIGIYYPLGKEINLLDLIKLYPDKIFALPKTVDGQIIYHEFNSKTVLEKTSFGLLEPKSGENLNLKLDLCLVPSLGMTKDNYRLGYGAGYFDRFFTLFNKPYKIGIIYQGEEVSFEPFDYDVKLDTYVSG